MVTIGPIHLNKGWMTDADVFNCPEGGALTFYGFEPWANGSIKTMDSPSAGFSIVQITGGHAPNGFTMWQDPAQLGVQNPIIVAPSNQKIYTALGPGFGTWTDRTGATTVSASGVYTFDTLNGNLLLFNSGGTGASFAIAPLVITTYNGNAALLGGTPPKGNIVKVCNNFAFVSQVLASASTVSTVYWSNVSDPTVWPAANNITFRQGDGDYVTALSAIGSTLFIFKSKSIGMLNTTTTSVSGAVTLGPLSTFSDRIGCVGHQAIDTMPDGTIVFLALDRNIYQTDGTTITCLSDKPAPMSNIQPGVSFPLGGAFAPFIYGTDGFPYASLRVDPMFHRILVMMTTYTGAVNKVYMFDYLSNVWADWTELDNDTATGNFGTINCMSVMPQQIANSSGLGNSAWLGWSNGYLTNFTPYGFLQHFSVATTWNNVFETSIQLGSSSPPEFIPRNVLIPISFPNSSGTVAGIIKVRIGFDGVYASSDAYTSGTITIPPNNLMVKVPISELVRSGQTFIHPRTMQIKITLTGNTTMDQMIIEPIYISDEVFQ